MDAAVFVLSCYPLLQRVYLIFTSLFAQKRISLTVCFLVLFPDAGVRLDLYNSMFPESDACCYPAWLLPAGQQ